MVASAAAFPSAAFVSAFSSVAFASASAGCCKETWPRMRVVVILSHFASRPLATTP
jgi:hypothetical protein